MTCSFPARVSRPALSELPCLSITFYLSLPHCLFNVFTHSFLYPLPHPFCNSTPHSLTPLMNGMSFSPTDFCLHDLICNHFSINYELYAVFTHFQMFSGLFFNHSLKYSLLIHQSFPQIFPGFFFNHSLKYSLAYASIIPLNIQSFPQIRGVHNMWIPRLYRSLQGVD